MKPKSVVNTSWWPKIYKALKPFWLLNLLSIAKVVAIFKWACHCPQQLPPTWKHPVFVLTSPTSLNCARERPHVLGHDSAELHCTTARPVLLTQYGQSGQLCTCSCCHQACKASPSWTSLGSSRKLIPVVSGFDVLPSVAVITLKVSKARAENLKQCSISKGCL